MNKHFEDKLTLQMIRNLAMRNKVIASSDAMHIFNALERSNQESSELHAQIAELQRKVEALAVENDRLDTFIKVECWTVDDTEDSYVDAADTMPETPSTDAALAEVRAQGVEMFVNKISSELRCAGGGDGYHTNFYPELADHLESKGSDFSSELRKESGND